MCLIRVIGSGAWGRIKNKGLVKPPKLRTGSCNVGFMHRCIVLFSHSRGNCCMHACASTTHRWCCQGHVVLSKGMWLSTHDTLLPIIPHHMCILVASIGRMYPVPGGTPQGRMLWVSQSPFNWGIRETAGHGQSMPRQAQGLHSCFAGLVRMVTLHAGRVNFHSDSAMCVLPPQASRPSKPSVSTGHCDQQAHNNSWREHSDFMPVLRLHVPRPCIPEQDSRLAPGHQS